MTELQNYRMTELQNDRQDKNNMPPDLRSRGHKKRDGSKREKVAKRCEKGSMKFVITWKFHSESIRDLGKFSYNNFKCQKAY